MSMWNKTDQYSNDNAITMILQLNEFEMSYF